ncbi:MAG: PAS domain S-box protein [Acidimicrobiales bacterium]
METGAGRSRPEADLLSTVLESAPDGILIVGVDGRIELTNRELERLFGHSQEELLGQPIELLVPETARDAHVAHRQGYAAEPEPRPMGAGLALVGRHKDGHPVEVDISLSPLTGGGGTVAVVRDATARREAERKVAYLASIVESSDDAIFGQDLEGNVTSWNRGAERLYGYRSEEILGQPATTLVPTWRISTWVSRELQVRSGEHVEHAEVETRRKDGLPVPVSLTMSPIVDAHGHIVGVSTIARDRTEQQLALETLADAAERLREGEALAHIGGWVLDRASGDVQWSEEMHRIHGVEPVAFDGTLDAHLGAVDPGDRAEVQRTFEAALESGELFEGEYRIVRPDRTIRWVYATAYPVRSGSGDIIGMRGICQDVTDRREAEDSIRAAYARERAAAEELRIADQLKDEFLATVSHELRTPLTIILGFANLAATQDHRRAELLPPIVRNADEMHRMIERLLDFTRLQAGRVESRIARLNLSEAVATCLDKSASVLREHEVIVDVDPTLEVDADPDGVERVLGNLLSNAVKFSPPGTSVTVRATYDGEARVVVSVTDQGRGVPPEFQARVFDRFFQAPDQPPGKRGTGIGLAIARRYTELMGGRIWCDASARSGATFAFSLPIGGGG